MMQDLERETQAYAGGIEQNRGYPPVVFICKLEVVPRVSTSQQTTVPPVEDCVTWIELTAGKVQRLLESCNVDTIFLLMNSTLPVYCQFQ